MDYGWSMKFDLQKSFEDNLALFRAEAEKLDKECADILFKNLATLFKDGGEQPSREAITEFNKLVLAAVMELPAQSDGN